MAENIKATPGGQPAPAGQPEAACWPASGSCAECGAVFSDPAKKLAFGYQAASAPCACHDICVEDVRDISSRSRTLTHCVPCNPDGRAGCRGGFLPDGVPAIVSYRVLCAEESLPSTCDRVGVKVEFEVVLRYGATTLAVVTPIDMFEILWHQFARFPGGVFYPNNTAGQTQFRNELAVIDGSCMTVIFESVTVGTEGNDCMLTINYKLVDKLWKYENLLVSAIKPYAGVGDSVPVTICETFGSGHYIGPCADSGPCGSGAPA